MAKIISALLKPGYNPKETNSDKLKEFLDIDRENVEKLKKQGINFNLNFFVQYDKEKQEYQKINTKIEVQNFEEINRKYHLIRDNEWADKAKKHIQEGYLDIDDINYLLTEFRIGKNREFEPEEYKEFFEKYTKEDRKNNKKYSLKEALVFMDQYVKANSQLKIRKK
ncbi:MAG: hypothetical protein K6E76_07455 [Patescibacteria group bacterium]|nr:hypothetical protein [Patescibacteria group bacterium]